MLQTILEIPSSNTILKSDLKTIPELIETDLETIFNYS